MWRGGVHAVCSKWERHKLTQHAATSDFSLGVTYQRMSEARELRDYERVFANNRRSFRLNVRGAMNCATTNERGA